MSIYIGNNKYKEIYLGSNKISEVYLGSINIYSNNYQTYNVYCSGTNGTVLASPSNGRTGTTVTLSNTPNSGYVFDSYTISGATLKNSNQFDIGNTDVYVTGNFIQSSGEIWVDLGSTEYTVNKSSSYVSLTGMPSSPDKLYYTVKFDLGGTGVSTLPSIGTSYYAVLCNNGSFANCLFGLYGLAKCYNSSGTNVGAKAIVGNITKGGSGVIYSSDFALGYNTTALNKQIAYKSSAFSSSYTSNKFVVDRSNNDIYYYLSDVLKYKVHLGAINMSNSNAIYIKSATNGKPTNIKNIKVIGYSTLAEAQAS